MVVPGGLSLGGGVLDDEKQRRIRAHALQPAGTLDTTFDASYVISPVSVGHSLMLSLRGSLMGSGRPNYKQEGWQRDWRQS